MINLVSFVKTFSLREKDIDRPWYIVDGQNLVFGRLASIIAKILRGKNDPQYTPHMNHGGCVILVNAHKLCFRGQKDKTFYWHTGYPGGIKSRKFSQILTGPYPSRLIKKGVERMLGSSGPLKRDRMRNFYVYADEHHPHAGQKPLALDIANWNRKNSQQGR
jgi:large subunit ribosomal protein L13